MAFSPETYALAKKLDNAVLTGVVSHSVDNVNKSITFTFKDGTNSTIKFDNPSNGVDGVGIATMDKDSNNHLIVTLTNGSTIDVGELPVGELPVGSGSTVADVPFTELSVNYWARGSVIYTVKNGICYLWLSGIESSTMDKSNQIIVNNLPKAKRGGLWCNITSSDCTKGGLLVTVTPDGKLLNYSGLNNTVYFGTFSYPVAE